MLLSILARDYRDGGFIMLFRQYGWLHKSDTRPCCRSENGRARTDFRRRFAALLRRSHFEGGDFALFCWTPHAFALLRRLYM
jgi:hypothetical protein